MKKFLLLLPFIFGSAAHANEEALICYTNSNEYYYVSIQDQIVIHTVFLRETAALELSDFSPYGRCPGCYRFEGTAHGDKYVGMTRAGFGLSGTNYFLQITINGEKQSEIECGVE
jgi:hypothetical protein